MRIFSTTTILSTILFINKHYWVMAAVLVVIIGGAMAFPPSYFSNTNVLLGICLVPFSIWITGKQRVNFFLLIALFGSGVLTAIYPVKIFYFFAIALFILLLLEIYVGKLNSIVLFLLVFMSPFFEQVTGILGFPIRLQLSHLAGSMLQLAGLNVQVEGNMMLLNGNSFTVDDACMGLSMLSVSLLIGVFVIVHQYKKRRRVLSFISLSGFFLFVLVLNVVCNLLRIVVLVLFSIGPDHVMHEGVGIICFVTYIMIPLYFLSRWMVTRFGEGLDDVTRSYKRMSIFHKSAIACLALCLLWIGVNFTERRASLIVQSKIEVPTIVGMDTTELHDGVIKMSNSEVLIYLKPIGEFFSGEHTPLFCWKGSGYQFKKVRENIVDGRKIYCGEMVKPEGTLWTAWWYANGEVQTIDQFDWRFRMLKGEQAFNLMNVTAGDEQTVLRYTRVLLDPSKNN